jgi:hypothetical protein
MTPGEICSRAPVSLNATMAARRASAARSRLWPPRAAARDPLHVWALEPSRNVTYAPAMFRAALGVVVVLRLRLIDLWHRTTAY